MINKLKTITWDEPWENYIKYRYHKEPLLFDRYGNRMHHDLPAPNILKIINVMEQLKYKMTVYEAYLKGVEAVAGSVTNNQFGLIKKELIMLKKLEIKNIRKGIFDEELEDYIEAMMRGYKLWHKNRNSIIAGSPVTGKSLDFKRKL